MNTDIAKTPLRQVSSVKQLLMNDAARAQLASVAASHMKPERMMRLMANAIRTTPQLGECEPITLLGAMMTSASLGLEPNTPLGHAYLIPFKNRRKNVTEVTFIIGYKGMISLARRSGSVVNIHADVVYDGDDFSYEYGSNQHLRHKPIGRRENPQYAYCHAKLTDGEAFIVLPWAVVMEVRDASQGYKTAIKYGRTDNPWQAHEHAMAKKTAVRRLFDELPISIEEVSDAMGVDEAHADFQSFAFDPSTGMPQGDGEVIEGEVEEAEDKPKQKAKAAEKKPAPKKDETPHDPETGEVKEEDEGNQVDPEKFKELTDNLLNELSQAPSLDDFYSLYEPQVEQIKEHAPKEFERLQAELEAFENSGPGTG